MRSLSLIDKAFILKKSLLFRELDLDLLLTIADKMTPFSFNAGESIFLVQQEGKKMYFIVEGAVALQNPQDLSSNLISAPDFFGDESLFNSRPRGYNAVCNSATTLLALSRTNLLLIIAECPSVALGLLESYTAKLDLRLR